MGPIAEQILDGSIVAVVTAACTILAMLWRMERRYRTIADARLCMEKREQSERRVEEALELTRKRLILGNLILLRLCKELKISDEDVRQMKAAVEVNMHDE